MKTSKLAAVASRLNGSDCAYCLMMSQIIRISCCYISEAFYQISSLYNDWVFLIGQLWFGLIV